MFVSGEPKTLWAQPLPPKSNLARFPRQRCCLVVRCRACFVPCAWRSVLHCAMLCLRPRMPQICASGRLCSSDALPARFPSSLSACVRIPPHVHIERDDFNAFAAIAVASDDVVSTPNSIASSVSSVAPVKRTLNVWGFAFVTYFIVSGGPFGIEVAVRAAGALPVVIGFFVMPFIFALPQVRMQPLNASPCPRFCTW